MKIPAGEGYAVHDGMIFQTQADVYTSRQDAEAAIRPKNFIIGRSYQWKPRPTHQYNHQAPHHQGKRHGPLVCVYVGQHQGLFEDQISEAGAFKNAAGLHIIATGHLISGDFIEV